MKYSEMDKRKMVLPDLLGNPVAMIDEDGNLITLKDFQFPANHYVFVYPIEEWKQIKEIRGQ